MLTIELTVDEIVDIIATTDDADLLRRCREALNRAVHQLAAVEIVAFDRDRGIIPAIKVLRGQFGWSLQHAKNFCDDIRGSWDPRVNWYAGGAPKVVHVPHAEFSQFTAALRSAGVTLKEPA